MSKQTIQEVRDKGVNNPFDYNHCLTVYGKSINDIKLFEKPLKDKLIRNNINLIGDLVLMNEISLLCLHGIGKTAVDTIKRGLANEGLFLGMLEPMLYTYDPNIHGKALKISVMCYEIADYQKELERNKKLHGDDFWMVESCRKRISALNIQVNEMLK